MMRWVRMLTLGIVLASTASCSLLPKRDHGRYHSLPKTCDELFSPSNIHDALVKAMHQDVLGALKVTDSTTKGFRESVDCDVTTERHGYQENASFIPGKPRARMLYLTYTLYKKDGFGDDSVADAHRFLRPDKQLLMGAALEERADLGDEAVAWWDTMLPLQARRRVAFRVSNVKVELRFGGGDDMADSSKLDMMDNPQLRQRLDAEVTGLAQAIALWLRNDWKG